MKYIDAILNRIPMYRLMMFGLSGLFTVAVALALFGRLPYEPLHMVLSLSAIAVGALATEYALSLAWGRPLNRESWFITSLIIFFIVPVADSLIPLVILFVAGMIASASKFLIAWHGKHILNPAAFAAALLSILGIWSTSWWVGSTALWWAVLILGLLVIRKVRHVKLVLLFTGIAIVLQLIRFILDGQLSAMNIQSMLIASPLIFFATIMLTEPATMPSKKLHQYIFAAGVGVLYSLNLAIGPLEIYPEVALLLANVYAFIVSPKFSTRMTLQKIERTASQNVASFRFIPDTHFTFKPGQYMAWTLPGVPLELRGGNRRTFTIASSPTEKEVLLGVKFYSPSSAFKTVLHNLKVGDAIYVSQLSGSFTLPKNSNEKLLFIAGGIGITPFRSMLRYLIDTKQHRDVTLVYAAKDEAEFAYTDLLNEAKAYGVSVHLVAGVPPNTPTPGILYGVLSSDVLQKLVPDTTSRHVYVSGPNGMVDDLKAQLVHMGVPRRAITTDHFSGY